MILNGKVINPGDLRTKVTLKSRTVTNDGGGFQVPTWTTIADVWAMWTNTYGYEAWHAAMAGAKQPATVLIRYRDDVDPTCAVEMDGELYEIVSVDDIHAKNEYIELKVQIMRSG